MRRSCVCRKHYSLRREDSNVFFKTVNRFTETRVDREFVSYGFASSFSNSSFSRLYCNTRLSSNEEEHKVTRNDLEHLEFMAVGRRKETLEDVYLRGLDLLHGTNRVTKDLQLAAQYFQQAAILGHLEAQNMVAKCLFESIGITQNQTAAIGWWKKAAEKGNSNSMFHLALCYFTGIGVNKDLKEALRWLKDAAEKAHPEALYQMALIHKEGLKKEQLENDGNGKQAMEAKEVFLVHPSQSNWLKLLKRAAESGHPEAQYQLGCIYNNCHKEDLDIIDESSTSNNFNNRTKTEAFRWWKEAAERSHREAQFLTARCLLDGNGVEEKDPKEAVRWLREAATPTTASSISPSAFKSTASVTTATEGHLDAQILLAECLFAGVGIEEKNYKEAVEWLSRVVQRDASKASRCFEMCLHAAKVDRDPHAVHFVGHCYVVACGVASGQETEGVYWLREAAEKGHPAAQYELGACYHGGVGTGAADTREALRWYMMAAENGNAEGLYNAGLCFVKGDGGVARDLEKGKELLTKAGEAGHAKAQMAMGVFHHIYGRVEKSAHWLRRAADHGNRDAQEAVAAFFTVEEDKVEEEIDRDKQIALRFWRMGAQRGDPESEVKLAYFHLKGEGGLRPSAGDAFPLFRKAAERGHAEAQYALGNCYARGMGVFQDDTQAVTWWLRAAAHNHVAAQTSLGNRFYNGLPDRGGAVLDTAAGSISTDDEGRNFDEAAKWYRKAAESGDSTAMYGWALCLQEGDGVEQDLYEALKWFKRASQSGNSLATERYKLLQNALSSHALTFSDSTSSDAQHSPQEQVQKT